MEQLQLGCSNVLGKLSSVWPRVLQCCHPGKTEHPVAHRLPSRPRELRYGHLILCLSLRFEAQDNARALSYVNRGRHTQ